LQATDCDGPVETANRAWCKQMKVPYFRISSRLSMKVDLDEKDEAKLDSMRAAHANFLVVHRQDIAKLIPLLSQDTGDPQ